MILDKYEIGFEIILVKGKIQKMEKNMTFVIEEGRIF